MASAISTPLEAEIQHFETLKDKLLVDHPGKFVVICGDKLLGAYDTFERAYDAGIEAFEERPFLVRRVTREGQSFTNLALLHGLINAHL